MSWAEVKKINDNITTPLNVQIENALNNTFTLITSSTTYTVPKTGRYRIICVGRGGESHEGSDPFSGGSGGVAIKIMDLVAGDEYSLTVGSTTEGFEMSCTSADENTGGSASGGDINLNGNDGERDNPIGASVPIHIPGISAKHFHYDMWSDEGSAEVMTFESGYGLCGLGYGAGYASYYSSSSHYESGPVGAPGFIIQCLQVKE